MTPSRRFALSLAAIAALAIAGSAFQVGPADAFGTWTWETKESSAYKVSANGTDFRVYEWTSERDPDMTCVAAFAQAGPVGLQCR